MKGFVNFVKRFLGLRKGESGFTLVELLVVVGIIVALAAVIIPNVASFAGKGEEGAMAAEEENIQTAFDTLLADKGVALLSAITGYAANNLATTGDGEQDFSATGIADLSSYLRDDTTKYWYCWDISGKVVDQFDVTATACVN